MFSSDAGVATNDAIQNSVEVPAVVQTVKDETEKFEQTYPLSANGRLNVSNVNGSITVEAWDRNEVKLEYTKTADTRERLADVEIRIDARSDSFSVEADYDSWKNKNNNKWKAGKLTVDFRLMAPRGAVLNEVETVNGSATVSNFTNMTRVSAVNGSVTATNIRGTAKLCTVNGEVTADFDRLESGSRINLETVNGRVSLMIPSDANATVRADSLNGNITNDFGLPVRKGKYVGRDLYGRIGSGDVQIKLESVNGALSIGRKNDGRQTGPATNLLPQKEQDEENWGHDEEGMFQGAMIEKEAAKAIKESVKASAKATADAQKEIEKLQPAIAAIATESIIATGKSLEETAAYLKSDEFKQKMKEVELRQKEMAKSMIDSSFFPSVPRVEKKSASFAMKGTPKVTVDAKGCSVRVRGWDKNEVQYNVTQFTDPRNKEAIKMTESHTDSSVTIKVENANYDLRNGLFVDNSRRARIEIFVPRKSNLKIDSNGEIRLEGVTGEVDLVGMNEAINVRDAGGSLRVVGSEARVRVIGFRGDIEAITNDGPINLEGDFNKLRAHSDGGTVFLTLPANTSADLEANCSDVTGEGLAFKRLTTQDELTKYRIGDGGRSFNIHAGGEIRLRAAESIKETY